MAESLFPTDPSALSVSIGQGAQPEFPRSWQFEFDAGEFVLDTAGRVATCADLEAYRQWAIKAVLTERYRYPIYTRQYGVEAGALLRQGLTSSLLESELTRTITEALLVDPRTSAVGEFTYVRSGGALEVSFTITTALRDTVPIAVRLGG